MAKIDLILTHWARYKSRVKCLKDTLNSLKTKLSATGHKLIITVGAESRDAPYQAEARLLCRDLGVNFLENPDEPNLGRNLNNLHQGTKNPWVLYVQDDFELELPLEIGPDVDLMIANPSIDMIRYTWRKINPADYHVSTYRSDLFQLNHPCSHLYSDNPHLRRRDWLERTGPYVTQDNAACENLMRRRANELSMKVLLTSKQPFRHSGIETVMWEKWARHPKGWAASLLVTPEMASRYDPETRMSWALHDCLVKILRSELPRKILELGPGVSSILIHQYTQKVPEIQYFSIGRLSSDRNKHVAYMKTLGFDVEKTSLTLKNGTKYEPLAVPFGIWDIFDLIIINEEYSLEMGDFLKAHIGDRTTLIFNDSADKGKQLVDLLLGSRPKDYYTQQIIKDDRSERESLVLIPATTEEPNKKRTMTRIINSERFGEIELEQIPQKVYELLWDLHDTNQVYRKDREYTHEYLLDRTFQVFKSLERRGLWKGRKRVLEIGPANGIFATLMRELGHIVECVEHPEEIGYRTILHGLAHHTHFFLITPDNLLPPELETGFDLINATGVQFDMYPDLSRWSTDLWIGVMRKWIEYLKPKGEIFLARNWETPPETTLRLVRHYQDPKFREFLDTHPRVETYNIKEEILTLKLK